jgi:hypothetical protein
MIKNEAPALLRYADVRVSLTRITDGPCYRPGTSG